MSETNTTNLNICYLLLWPYQATSVLGPLITVREPKDAPYFYDLDIEFRSSWGDRELELAGTLIRIQLQVLDELVWVAECRYTLTDAFGETAVERKRAIQTALKQKLYHETETTDSLAEEYTIVQLQHPSASPDRFINRHASVLGRLIRSLTKPLSEADANDILSARARYSEHDLTVVDWAGAVVIAESGDFQSDIGLLKIGKYQLLRYRMLDRTVQQMLQHIREHVVNHRVRWMPTRNKTLQTIVEQRLSLLLDFEKIDQSLLLIGDWYSAQVYQLIVERNGLNDWKELVKTKLDSVAAIDSVVQEHLTFSWRRALDLVMLIGWLVLLVGYFILFFVSP